MKDFSKITDSIYFKIAIVVIILMIIFAIYKGIQALINRRDSYSRDARQEFVRANLSYTDLEYENMSARLLDAMSGAGTRTSTIYTILKQLKTKDDWYKLVHTFGVRETTSMWSSWSGNLLEWLADELSSSEQQEVSNILSNLGVVF